MPLTRGEMGFPYRERKVDVHWETESHLELCARATTVQLMSVQEIPDIRCQTGVGTTW